MSAEAEEAAAMLVLVNAAITAILTGAQHFAIGDKQVTRADLEVLKDWRKDLQIEVAKDGKGVKVIGVTPSHG